MPYIEDENGNVSYYHKDINGVYTEISDKGFRRAVNKQKGRYEHETSQSALTSKQSANMYSTIYGRPEQGVLDNIKRSYKNIGYGLKQISGLTNPSEDEAWWKKEQEDANLTTNLTSMMALGAELGAGAGITSIPRTALNKLAKAYGKRQAANPGALTLRSGEAVKSLNNMIRYSDRFANNPIGGAAITAGVLGGTSPLNPTDMENEWSSRAKNSIASASMAKSLSTVGKLAGTLRGIKDSRVKEQELVSPNKTNLMRPMEFNRGTVNQDQLDLAKWDQALSGQRGEKAKKLAVGGKNITQKNFEDNVKGARAAFGGDPGTRYDMGYSNIDPQGKGLPYSTKAGGTWSVPREKMQRDAKSIKEQGKASYRKAKTYGDVRGSREELNARARQGREEIGDEFFASAKPKFIDDMFDEIEGMSKVRLDKEGNLVGPEDFSIFDLQAKHEKLNNSYISTPTPDNKGDQINRQIGIAKKYLDNLIDDVAKTGDIKAIDEVRRGRKLYTEWNNKYMNDSLMRDLSDPKMNSDTIANRLFPRDWDSVSNIQDKADSLKHVNTLYPEMKPHLKSDLFNSMSGGSPQNPVVDSTRYVEKYNKYKDKGGMSTIIEDLFDEDELSTLADLNRAAVLKNTNSSNVDFQADVSPNLLEAAVAKEGKKEKGQFFNVLDERMGAVPNTPGLGIGSVILSDEIPVGYSALKTNTRETKNNRLYDQIRRYLDR